jgi:hypothetical protein
MLTPVRVAFTSSMSMAVITTREEGGSGRGRDFSSRVAEPIELIDKRQSRARVSLLRNAVQRLEERARHPG